MKEIGQILTKFMLRNIAWDNEIGGPTFAVGTQIKRLPCAFRSGYGDGRSKDIESEFFQHVHVSIRQVIYHPLTTPSSPTLVYITSVLSTYFVPATMEEL